LYINRFTHSPHYSAYHKKNLPNERFFIKGQKGGLSETGFEWWFRNWEKLQY